MNMIVAVDENWGIGYKGDLLFSIPEDLKRFKEMTQGNNVILGRKTLESLPNSQPLPNRKHFLLTRNKEYTVTNRSELVEIFHDVESLLKEIEKIENKESIFVMGGSEIYKELLPYCNKVYVTKVSTVSEADVFINNFDLNEEWELISQDKKNNEKYNFSFCLYVRK